jgi:hypothetical protein
MTMMRRRSWGRIAMPAGALLCMAMAGSAAGRAAGIEWSTPGAFEACLDAQAKAWIDAKAELVLNDDPAAGQVDDAAVAAWTLRTISACEAKAGRLERASERLFARYMAHWREHIDAAVREVRRRSPPD